MHGLQRAASGRGLGPGHQDGQRALPWLGRQGAWGPVTQERLSGPAHCDSEMVFNS